MRLPHFGFLLRAVVNRCFTPVYMWSKCSEFHIKQTIEVCLPPFGKGKMPEMRCSTDAYRLIILLLCVTLPTSAVVSTLRVSQSVGIAGCEALLGQCGMDAKGPY